MPCPQGDGDSERGSVDPGAPRAPAADHVGWMSTASLVLGILGFVTCGITGICGLVLGLTARRRAPAGQTRRRANAGIIVSVAALAVTAGAPLRDTVLRRLDQHIRQASCQRRLRCLGRAFKAYEADFNGNGPLPETWCDSLQSYVPWADFPRCIQSQGRMGGYAYNSDLQQTRGVFSDADGQLVVVFDGAGGWNLTGGRESADPRHRDGLNALFADGRVRWLRPGDLSGLRWAPDDGSTAVTPPGADPGEHQTP